MVEPKVGVTHDIVLYVNNTAIGLIVKPATYVVRHLPTFIPQLTVGDVTGRDTSRWKSFVQSSFHQGAGQYFWSSPTANGGFAESNMWDIGLPTTIAGVVQRDEPGWAFGTNLAPSGHAIVAAVPQATTAGGLEARMFSAVYPVHLLEFSDAPFIIHNQMALCYTNVITGVAWAQALTGRPQEDLSGLWCKVATLNSIGSPIISATKFSGVMIMATAHSGMRVWGPLTSTGTEVGSYIPQYSTLASKLAMYDAKLWKAWKGQVAYLTPTGTTTNGWSEPYDLDDPSVQVTNMCEWAGRLYIGKEDGLHVFDQGKTYIVQEYRQERDTANFALMLSHRGSLYYNIRNQLYRLTGTGMIELIRTPWFGGNIIGGVPYINELIFLVGGSGPGGSGSSSVWIFNSETGGTRQWYQGIGQQMVDTNMAISTSPSFIGALRGYVFIAPQYLTGTVEPTFNTIAPILATNRAAFAEARKFDGAQLVTSGFDFGIPSLVKEFGALRIDAKMDSMSSIDVHIAAAPRELPSYLATTPLRIWTMIDSVLTYSIADATIDCSKYIAYAFSLPQRTYVTQGSVELDRPDVLTELDIEHTGPLGWTPVTPSLIAASGFSGSGTYAVQTDLGGITNWVAQPVIEDAGMAVYAIRERHVAMVPQFLTVAAATLMVIPAALRVRGTVRVTGTSSVMRIT